MKNSFLLTCIVLVLCACLFFPSCKKEGNNSAIAMIKSADWESNLGTEYTVEAFLALEPVPAIYANLNDRNVNSLIPENKYVRIVLDNSISTQLGSSYHGAKVRLTGILDKDRDPKADSVSLLLGSEYRAVLAVSLIPEILAESTLAVEAVVDICAVNPGLCTFTNITASETYVMIYSGGINAASAYGRYWNDMVFFYVTMAWFHGVDADKIKIVYTNGVPKNAYMPVHYPATTAGVSDAFDWFQEEMDGNDTFIFFATNHGGTGINDTNNDEAGSGNPDECIYYYNQSGNFLDDVLAAKINSLNFGRMAAILEPCFGGGLIRDLKGNNRVLISASTEQQVSWGGLQNYGNSYDDFVFHYTSALAGQWPDGTSVDADANNDGKVSLGEAFEYARVADKADETPQIDSDFDGIPHSTLGGESGSYASTFFIE